MELGFEIRDTPLELGDAALEPRHDHPAAISKERRRAGWS
jgi:hypothetical protein